MALGRKLTPLSPVAWAKLYKAAAIRVAATPPPPQRPSAAKAARVAFQAWLTGEECKQLTSQYWSIVAENGSDAANRWLLGKHQELHPEHRPRRGRRAGDLTRYGRTIAEMSVVIEELLAEVSI